MDLSFVETNFTLAKIIFLVRKSGKKTILGTHVPLPNIILNNPIISKPQSQKKIVPSY